MKVTGVNSRVGTTFGKYRITGRLGKGGMGEVYEAYDTSKDRTVALKILAQEHSHDEGFRTRFLRESRAAAKLQEPHVIPIHDWGEIDGNLYIDMRRVRGQTLHQLLERGPLKPSRAVSITNQIASALDAAHAEGLIHRDVKPLNIIVTPDDFAYLLDFGIAEAKGDTRLTMVGAHIGSLAYMAPERFDNRSTTPAVDVYSLACVLHEALTGDTPFSSKSMQQAIVAHISSPPPRPSVVNPNVPASFDEVIARGMAKEPNHRYGSAGAFGRAAQSALRADWRDAPRAGTMPGPSAVMPTVPYSPATPPPWRAAAPPMALPPVAQGSADRGGRWVLPTVITIAAVLVLGLIGVVIGLMASQDSGQTSSSTTAYASPSRGTSETESSTTRPTLTTTPTATALPPLVLGLDPSDKRCDDGFSLPTQTGWASRSGRGSEKTSCFFAESVLNAYWQSGTPTRAPRTISAAGSVPCTSVQGARCDGANFIMACAVEGSDDWITCRGGNEAVVYLY